MGYIKKLVSYMGKVSIRNNKNYDTQIDIDEQEEIEYKFAPVVVDAHGESIVNFESLLNFVEENEFKSVLKIAQERNNIKTKYIFGEVKNLF